VADASVSEGLQGREAVVASTGMAGPVRRSCGQLNRFKRHD